MNLKTHKHISFEESTHTYKNVKTLEKYTSGTTFIGKFHPNFNALSIATNLVENNKKYKNTTVEELLAQWSKSATVGTLIHSYLEKHLLGTLQRELIIASKNTITRVSQLTEAWDFLCLRDVYKDWDIIPERIIFLDDYKLAGQSDLVLLNHKNKTFKVLDYKTNKKGIPQVAYNNETMFAPVDHLPECKFTHYVLQLSLYSYMLEKELGYTCDGNEILWVDTNDETKVEIHQMGCPYLKEEIVHMLEWRSKK